MKSFLRNKNEQLMSHGGSSKKPGYPYHLPLLNQQVLYGSKITGRNYASNLIDEILIENVLDGRKTGEKAGNTTFEIFQNIS
jgi:hypothetical protein